MGAEDGGQRTQDTGRGEFGIRNGADGISDIEGKAATGSREQAGKRASFNGAAGRRHSTRRDREARG
jgi:hypothetical protein